VLNVQTTFWGVVWRWHFAKEKRRKKLSAARIIFKIKIRTSAHHRFHPGRKEKKIKEKN
jgi:hypothetical protein